ncbi:MAG: IS21-like element helper ATPase IstB [Candidatus Uhrbacteria bacterium]
MIHQTLEKLSEMHLHGFVRAVREQAESTKYQDLSFEERLALVVDQEYIRRKNSSLQRRLRLAQLKQIATIENIDFSPSRNLSKSDLLKYASGDWIANHLNIIITGPTGAGKTYLACALADKACRDGNQPRYIKAHDLASELLIARADGSLPRFVGRLSRCQPLIIDEWMRDPLPALQARELLDLLDARYEVASTVFVAQLPVEKWIQNFDDPTLADALLDRIVHSSYRVELGGESIRKLKTKIK